MATISMTNAATAALLWMISSIVCGRQRPVDLEHTRRDQAEPASPSRNGKPG